MAKLGSYSYPDIRFGDAVEIAGRILSKFKGTVNVKGLAWELGMAEGSGTLFAKVAALRDFGLVEGRGELHVTTLAQRILHPTSSDEARQARSEAFQQVELLRRLYNRFEGDVPDDAGLLIGLEEVTSAPRGEIIRRASLIQKHLGDACRALGRPGMGSESTEHSGEIEQIHANILDNLRNEKDYFREINGKAHTGNTHLLEVSGGGLQLSVPLTGQYLDVVISLLTTMKKELFNSEMRGPSLGNEGTGSLGGMDFGPVEQLEGAIEPLAQGAIHSDDSSGS